MKYRSDIDGLRSVAVIPVVVYHTGLGLSGGFVGVDVFFVISGYLISSIILDECANGRFSILRFYERRVRRIFPALLALVAAVLVVGWIVMIPHDFEKLMKSGIATLLFGSNVYFYFEIGYFDLQATLKPLLHTWSLGIEEQFYLVFPLVVVAIARLGLFRYAGMIFLVGALLSLLLADRWQGNQDANFYLPFSRAWELGIGAVLAAERTRLATIPRWFAELLGATGLAAILASVVLYTEATPFPGWGALPPCLGTAGVIVAGMQPRGLVCTRLLSIHALVAIGKVSYSLYLWHWPVVVFAGYGLARPLNTMEGLICLALSFMLAAASYVLVEQPVRRRKMFARPDRLFIAAGASSTAVVIVAGGVILADGVPQRLPSDPAWLGRMLDLMHHRRDCHFVTPKQLVQGDICIRGDSESVPSFALLGDSHADALSPSLFRVAAQQGLAGWQITAPGYQPRQSLRDERTTAVLGFLHKHPEVQTVFITGFWSHYLSSADPPRGHPRPEVLREPSSLSHDIIEGLGAFATALPDRSIVLLDDVPAGPEIDPNRVARALMVGRDPGSFNIAREIVDLYQDQYSPSLARLAAEIPNIVYHPILTDAMCDALACPMIDGSGSPMYRDADHLSPFAYSRLDETLSRLLTKTIGREDPELR